jgi:hypothetical protein
MCRSIKTLRDFENPPSDDEVHAAALQFVRKISGYRQPSRRNEEAFESAVSDIGAVSRRLLDSLSPPSQGTGAPQPRREMAGR